MSKEGEGIGFSNEGTILFYISGSYLGMFSLQYLPLHGWSDDLCIISMNGILQLKFLRASF